MSTWGKCTQGRTFQEVKVYDKQIGVKLVNCKLLDPVYLQFVPNSCFLLITFALVSLGLPVTWTALYPMHFHVAISLFCNILLLSIVVSFPAFKGTCSYVVIKNQKRLIISFAFPISRWHFVVVC